MRKFLFISVVACLAACAKQLPQYTWQSGNFAPSALTASTQSVTLSSSNDSVTVISFSWPLANFGYSAAATYTLQFDVASDTGGASPWGKAFTAAAGPDADSMSYLGVDFNALANDLSLAPGTPDTLLVRVQSAVQQIDGATSVIPPAYTNVVVVVVTPYSLDLYVPGAYQGWNPATAPTIAPFNSTYSYVYEGYVYMSPPGLNYFKYTSAPDWNHINYGDGGGGTMSTNGSAAGLSVPDSGYYEVTANLKNLTWTATKTTWSIIGDATPGGWNTDTQMIFDPQTQTWSVTCNMVQAGSFKFRANDEWVIDFGVDAGGNLAYSDNPIVYNPNTNNITVPSDGNYTITLNLTVSGKYTYTAVKN